MIWSILIPTIEGRELQFMSVTDYLTNQISLHGLEKQIEIVSIKDNCEMSIGTKRQQMIEQAKGIYISHVDDDDTVTDNYIPAVYNALKSKPDCVGFNVLCDFPTGMFKAVVSNKYKTWESDKDGYDYVRSPNHLAVIKREHCLKVGFKDMRFGEDADFSFRMVETGLLKNEVFIDEYLYTYKFRPKKT